MNGDKWVHRALDEIFTIESAGRRLTLKDRRRLRDSLCQTMRAQERSFDTDHLELLVCEDCNLRCDYCFMETKNPKVMSPEIGMRSVDFLLSECRDLHNLGILFFGGEPLLSFPTIKAVIEYAESVIPAKGKTIGFSMTTNGILFTEESLEFFKAHKVGVLLSLDGPEWVNDAHRKTCSGAGSYRLLAEKLQLIFKYLGPVQVRITPHPDTIGHLSKSIRHLLELGFGDFIVGSAHGLEWSEEEYALYDREMEATVDMAFPAGRDAPSFLVTPFHGRVIQCSWGCRAGRRYLCIGADGRIGPCSLIMGTPGLDERYVFGSVTDGSVDHAVRMEFNVLQAYRSEECLRCDIRSLCSGGCPGSNYKATGSILYPAYQQCQEARHKLKHQRAWHQRLEAARNRAKPRFEVLNPV